MDHETRQNLLDISRILKMHHKKLYSSESRFLGGTASTAVSAVADDLTILGQVVQNGIAVAQGLGSSASATTTAAAIAPLVQQALLSSELLSGKKVTDQAAFVQGSTALVAALQTILDAVSGA